MADLLVRVRQIGNPQTAYADGDIVTAWNDTRIGYTWAAWIYRRNKLLLKDAWFDIMEPVTQVPIGGGLFRASRTPKVNDPAAIAAIWSEIERLTPHRRADFTEAPVGRLELRNNVMIAVDDFDAETRRAMEAVEVDDENAESPVMLRRRKMTVDWRALPGIDIARALDQADAYDARPGPSPRAPENVRHRWSNIVQTKAPL